MIKYFIDGVPHFIADNQTVTHNRASSKQRMYSKFVELLQKNNKTPYQVSKATGISQSTLSDWKTGRAKPKADKLLKLAEYFGVTVDYFLKEEN